MTIENELANELTQARINLLEMQIKAIKDSLPSSVDEIIKVDIGGLEPGLQEIMTDIMGKMTSPHTETKHENAVVKKSQIKILKDALYIDGVLVSKNMPMTADIRYKIGASTEVIIHCFPKELIIEERKNDN